MTFRTLEIVLLCKTWYMCMHSIVNTQCFSFLNLVGCEGMHVDTFINQFIVHIISTSLFVCLFVCFLFHFHLTRPSVCLLYHHTLNSMYTYMYVVCTLDSMYTYMYEVCTRLCMYHVRVHDRPTSQRL